MSKNEHRDRYVLKAYIFQGRQSCTRAVPERVKRKGLPSHAGEELHHLCFWPHRLQGQQASRASQGIDERLQLEGAVCKAGERGRLGKAGGQQASSHCRLCIALHAKFGGDTEHRPPAPCD